MMFTDFFQYLGNHTPALGAFLVILAFVAALCFVFYKLGRRAADKRWTWDVEHMPAVIGQDVRERKDRVIVQQATRIKYLEERNDQFVPALRGMAAMAEKFAKEG